VGEELRRQAGWRHPGLVEHQHRARREPVGAVELGEQPVHRDRRDLCHLAELPRRPASGRRTDGAPSLAERGFR
jgi:hypothetical protein